MALRHLIALVFTLTGLCALAEALPAPAHATESTPATKAKKHRGEATLAPAAPTPAELYAAPLQLNFDPLKNGLMKSEPVLPYLPQSQTKPLPAPKVASDDDVPDQPHLAPLLRESSLPDSFGDRGTFLERHEFGIQLRDHF